jgi:prevent-host-death family protein
LRTYALDEAQAELSKVVDRALAGEPQRITRQGKRAVILVSEADWLARRRRSATLGDLLANFAESSTAHEEPLGASPSISQTRELGLDFVDDEDLPKEV